MLERGRQLVRICALKQEAPVYRGGRTPQKKFERPRPTKVHLLMRHLASGAWSPKGLAGWAGRSPLPPRAAQLLHKNLERELGLGAAGSGCTGSPHGGRHKPRSPGGGDREATLSPAQCAPPGIQATRLGKAPAMCRGLRGAGVPSPGDGTSRRPSPPACTDRRPQEPSAVSQTAQGAPTTSPHHGGPGGGGSLSGHPSPPGRGRLQAPAGSPGRYWSPLPSGHALSSYPL